MNVTLSIFHVMAPAELVLRVMKLTFLYDGASPRYDAVLSSQWLDPKSSSRDVCRIDLVVAELGRSSPLLVYEVSQGL
jgi:hypothetical protein